MDEPGTVLRGAGLVLRLDASGTVVSAAAGSSAPWLVAAGSIEVRTAAGPLTLDAPRVRVDADEVEVERSGGGLRTVVRHSVEHAWVVRVVLANETDDELALTAVRVGWRAAPGTVVVALAAGSEAAYAVQPADGAGPLLVARLRAGAQAGVDEDGLVLVPPVLAPGHRWAAQWRLEVVPDARHAHPLGDLPRTTWLDLDQTVLLPAGPDVAVVADGLAVEVGEDRVAIGAAVPGAYTVELRSARGTTTYGFGWAPDLDDLVDAAADAALDGPTTPGGTPRLDGSVAGLLVQDALGRRSVAADAAVDALELLAGRLVEQVDDALGIEEAAVAFLAREADRTGDAALLDAAATGLRALTRAAPGTGLAGAAVVLGHLRAGRPADGLLADLGSLLPATTSDAGGLELALLLRPRGPVPSTTLVDGLRRLGAGLGAGLPGRVVPRPPVDEVAHASVVLGLVDEAVGQRLRRTWGVPAAELARRCRAEARARTVDPAEVTRGRALAWLVLGRSPS